MKKLPLLFIILLFCGVADAQDIIKMKSGAVIKADVKNISESSLQVTVPDSAGISERTLMKSEMEYVHFANGVEMLFGETPTKASTLEDTTGRSEYYKKGMREATLYYSGYKTAGTATLISGLAFPVLGLIPAISCSSTTPSPENLQIRNDSLARNPDYYSGYSNQASKIKSKKVWKNYGIGAGISMGLRILLVAASLTIALTGY